MVIAKMERLGMLAAVWLLIQSCVPADAQTLVFPTDYGGDGAVYVSPQALSGSGPQIIGYQIVPSENYAGESVQQQGQPDGAILQAAYPGHVQQDTLGQQQQQQQQQQQSDAAILLAAYQAQHQFTPGPQPLQQNQQQQQQTDPVSLLAAYQAQQGFTQGQSDAVQAGGSYPQPRRQQRQQQQQQQQRQQQPQQRQQYGNQRTRAVSQQAQTGGYARNPSDRQIQTYIPYSDTQSVSSSRKSLRSQTNRRRRGYGQRDKKKTPVYVPVPVKQQRRKRQKKVKSLSVSRGFYIIGGTQLYGKFRSLQACQRACDRTPNCFAGDYDKTTYRCYIHDSQTACDAMSPHRILTHFKKIPCSVSDLGISNGLLSLGSNLFHGLLQKGVNDIQTCLKKCLQAGGGVAPSHAAAASTPHICFGIDYDFATHRCYHHTSATVVAIDAGTGLPVNVVLGYDKGIMCTEGTPLAAPQGFGVNSNVVNIIICPSL